MLQEKVGVNQVKMKSQKVVYEKAKKKNRNGKWSTNLVKMLMIWIVVTCLYCPSILVAAMEAPFSESFFKENSVQDYLIKTFEPEI